jgi:hypothetical protein
MKRLLDDEAGTGQRTAQLLECLMMMTTVKGEFTEKTQA